MDRKVRIHEMAQGESQNIQVIEKITLVVHSIGERTNRVLFTVNPNITDYHETPKRQGVGYESTNDPPFSITVDGTDYRIALDSVGTEQRGVRRAYCDFVISC